MIDLNVFDEWNQQKKRLQSKNMIKYFKERQVWWCSIGQNIGVETYGKGKTFSRPVVVLKKLSNEIFLGIPLSSKKKTGTWYVQFRHRGTEMSALFSQVRIFDRRRLLNRLGELDDEDFNRIKTGFKSLFCG